MEILATQPEERKNQKTDPHQNIFRRTREALTAHIAEFEDPILAALKGIGLDVIEVCKHWVDLEAQAHQAWEEAFDRGENPLVALNKKRQEIARRLIAAQEGTGY